MKTKRRLSLLLATIMLLGVLPAAMGEEPAIEEAPVFDEEPMIVTEEEPAEGDADGVMIEAVTEPEIAEEEEIILGEAEPEEGEAEAPQYADFLMEGEEDDGGEYAVLAAPAGSIAIDATNFPDTVFRTYVSLKYDTDKNGTLSEKECAAVTKIDWLGEYVEDIEHGITNLKGIEHFNNLSYLRVDDWGCFYLTKLDVSKNASLRYLELYSIYACDSFTLNASNCTALEEIHCNDVGLSSINISGCTSLKILNCSYCPLKSLDVSTCTSLVELNCEQTNLTRLNIRNNKKLKRLYLSYCGISDLDLNGCTSLESLEIMGVVNLETLDVSGCALSKLEISDNPSLYFLVCDDNKLSQLDISGCDILVDLVNGYKTGDTLRDIYKGTISYDDDINAAMWFDSSTKLIADGKTLYSPQPTSVSLAQTAVNLGVGEKLKLNPTLKPVGVTSKLTYKSTKTKYATVAADGTITAKKKGTTYVTVTTANGKKATIKVVVKKAPSKVTISPKKLILNEGLTGQLKATLPKKTTGKVTFTSNNTKVAKVDANGKVTAVAAGTATITAKTYNGKTSACTVTVLTGKAPTKLTLNMTSVKLGKGQKEKIVPSVQSGGNTVYTYSSSRKKVATVAADGTITGKKKGKAVITVKTHNGLAAKVTVTVSNAPKKVTLSAKTLILNVGASGKLTAKLPKGTYSPITLTSSSTGIATVDASGSVKAVKAGTATITAKTFNNKTANCVVTVLTGTAPTSVTVPEATITLAKGSTYKIVPKLNSGANTVFTYTAKNKTKNKKKIATVSADGTITAKVKGTAIITVKTHNGKTATVTVIVK